MSTSSLVKTLVFVNGFFNHLSKSKPNGFLPLQLSQISYSVYNASIFASGSFNYLSQININGLLPLQL